MGSIVTGRARFGSRKRGFYLDFLLWWPTPLGVTETLPTWVPGRNPFAAVNVYLRNHPGISQDFSGFYFAKPYLGWVGQTWLGSLKTRN